MKIWIQDQKRKTEWQEYAYGIFFWVLFFLALIFDSPVWLFGSLVMLCLTLISVTELHIQSE